MQTPVMEQTAERLHASSARLRACMDSIVSEQQDRALSLRPQRVSELLAELMDTGKFLQSLPQERSPELQHEIYEYRRNVERLRDLLPAIHKSLLQERARLEQERLRIDSAGEWARRSRETL